VRRGDTGVRALLTLLFVLVWTAIESVLMVIVLFSVVWALISCQTPPERLRRAANALVAYAYGIWRYLTYADPRVPFPFSEFPAPVDPLGDLGTDGASEVRSLLDSD
jgi:D-alanyl-lipoteichoic acid acyltransferase DltB (MBOAT superfamily)